jgi:hypothetical protein
MSLIKLKNNALDNLTSFEGSASLGDMVFISSATASSSASIEFDLGSYKEYKIFGLNLHPSTDSIAWNFNFSTDNGSNYNVSKTTTSFRATHGEDDGNPALEYVDNDLANGTGEQVLIPAPSSSDADHGAAFIMHIFNPSSTTFVKHFIVTGNHTSNANISTNGFIAGYANTTSALTNIRFKASSGNIDDGKILMFGLN